MPKKPYLIRAIYDWCIDAGLTPYITAIINKNVLVPKAYHSEYEITLNISTEAVSKLLLDDDAVSFISRFNGVSEHIYIPTNFVKGIFAKETGEGIFFEVSNDSESKKNKPKNLSQNNEKKPYLKLVK